MGDGFADAVLYCTAADMMGRWRDSEAERVIR